MLHPIVLAVGLVLALLPEPVSEKNQTPRRGYFAEL